MLKPRILFQIEANRKKFIPAVCPHKDCEFRGVKPVSDNWYKKIGCYYRKHDRCKVARYQCRQGSKKHTFSVATYTDSYWLHRRNLMPRIAKLLCEGISIRGIARSLKVSETCVSKQIWRIGRKCMLIHQRCLEALEEKKLTQLCFDELVQLGVNKPIPSMYKY